jgi:hypothetical protein
MKMIPNHVMRRRIDLVVLSLVLPGLVGSLLAQGITPSPPKSPPAPTRTLPFPSSPCVGNLYFEPESGLGWELKGVRPDGKWEYFAAAQGEVRVPRNRKVRLWLDLALSPAEAARLRAENPQCYQLTIADRVRPRPADLSGLAKLEPNDLRYLEVSSEMYYRAGVSPEVFAPLRRLTGLEMLGLHSSGVTDEGLQHLRALRSLKGLELTQFPVGNRGLAVLKDLPALEYLSLNTGLTDAGLKEVAQISSLRWLSIMGGRMWGPGLAELAKLPRLERLCFWGARGGGPIYDRHLKYLEGVKQIRSLTLYGVDALTDASLASISKIENLEELYFIMAAPKFTPAGLAHLRNLKGLKKVDFAMTWAGRPGEQYGDEVARQLATMPQLESIEGIGYLSAEGMKTLATCHDLKCLHVTLKDRRQGYHGPTGLSHLAGLHSLEKLLIGSGDPLTDADLISLEPLTGLKDLSIFGPGMSDRGLASIGKLKQLERLHLSTETRSGLNCLNNLSNLQYLKVAAWHGAVTTTSADELLLDLSGLKKMRELYLSGLPLHDDDLAFLKRLPLLETLMIQPSSSLTGASLRHLGELPQLYRLWVLGLSNCTGQDLAGLSNLPKLRELRIGGDLMDTVLASLAGPPSLHSLMVETDNPIRKETVAELTKSHLGIESIHISVLTPIQAKPAGRPASPGVSPRRADPRSPTNRRVRR